MKHARWFLALVLLLGALVLGFNDFGLAGIGAGLVLAVAAASVFLGSPPWRWWS